MDEELEALHTLVKFIETEYNSDVFYQIREAKTILEQALHRLEAIDNSNPSEALECLENIGNWELANSCMEKVNESDEFATINQALLKAQEPKHYLKWEDLEFSYGDWKYQEVKLNGAKYTIKYKGDFDFFDNYYEIVKIYNQNERKQLFKLYNNKQFFNDLRLERVE